MNWISVLQKSQQICVLCACDGNKEEQTMAGSTLPLKWINFVREVFQDIFIHLFQWTILYAIHALSGVRSGKQVFFSSVFLAFVQCYHSAPNPLSAEFYFARRKRQVDYAKLKTIYLWYEWRSHANFEIYSSSLEIVACASFHAAVRITNLNMCCEIILLQFPSFPSTFWQLKAT